MLVTIGDYLPGMRVYEKIFKGHPDLLHSLSEVYLDIITFCMDANKVFKEIKQAKGILAIPEQKLKSNLIPSLLHTKLQYGAPPRLKFFGGPSIENSVRLWITFADTKQT